MGPNIVEIIPDDMPDWMKEAMDAGQLFNTVIARDKEAIVMSKESARALCDALDLTSEFFDEDSEEYIMLREGNPELFQAYGELFTIACVDD